MGEHRVPDLAAWCLSEPVYDLIKAQDVTHLVAKIFALPWLEQPGELVDVTDAGGARVYSCAKSAVGLAYVVQESERGQPSAVDFIKLCQPGCMGKATVEGGLRQQRFNDGGHIS